MSRRFAEMNQLRVAAVGLVITAVVVGAALNVGVIRTTLFGESYSAVFGTAAGLRGGEDVRVFGHTVGEVQDLELDGNRIVVDFTLTGDAQLGARTRATVKIENPLGAKFLALIPRGSGALPSGAQIPIQRTDVPLSITDALSRLTTTTARIDTGRLADSFDTLSTTFSDTPAELRAAVRGVRRLSATIASRDQALGRLLDHAEGVTGVLAERNRQITTLVADGNLLFAELQRRRAVLDRLLVNVTAVTRQLSGFVADNAQTLQPALAELRTSLEVLNRNEDNLREALQILDGYARSLNESLGGGPWFYVYLQNIVPSNIAPCLATLGGAGGAQPGPPPADCLAPGSAGGLGG